MSKKLYQTSDGIKFYHEQDAKNHALSLEDRKVNQVDGEQKKVDSKSGDFAQQENREPKTNNKSAAELIAEIKQVETLEQLNAYEVHKQVTVKAAVEKRRSELTANIEVDLGEGTGNGEENHGLQIRDNGNVEPKTGNEEQEDVKEDKGE
ncbi:hypothetical protein MODO_3131 [Myroides odoratimimus]|uniref:hypothetical protein n=1 Tax=Myroides odoratimimus TaxID=76832 RepID=UPI00072AC365|nr:hypothetical protein [Myroides odoratimimus]GAQ15435.1 hypothetical protein MODO_3131 [Myroides odoratimimus]STZ48133.1 Uncharacterised protein [Myroides odoratimimus]